MTVFQVMMIMIYNDNNDDLGGGFNFFYFYPCLGKISNLTNTFFRWVGSTTNEVKFYQPGKNLRFRDLFWDGENVAFLAKVK